MKELENFTVERLEELASFEQWHETAALAKIALAVKNAEPVAYADPLAFVNFQEGTATKEWMWDKPDCGLMPLYSTPQPTGTNEQFKILPFSERMKLLGKALSEHTPESLYAELQKYPAFGAPITPQPAENWIACSERMPDEGELIIFSTRNYDVTTGHYEERNSLFFGEDGVIYHFDGITHWQPLPAAPKGE